MKSLKKARFVTAVMVAAVSLIAANAFAQDHQFRLGVTAGLESSKLSSSGSEWGMTIRADTDSKAGFKFGIVGEYSFNENFAVAPELVFTQRGGKRERSSSGGDWQGNSYSYKSSININYLQIPINAKFSYPINEDFKMFGFAGPYFAFALSGKTTNEMNWTDDYGERRSEKTENDLMDEIKRLDFGLNFGAGAEYKNIFVRVQYDLGGNIVKDAKGDENASNRNFGVSVGYMFNF